MEKKKDIIKELERREDKIDKLFESIHKQQDEAYRLLKEMDEIIDKPSARRTK